MQNSESTKGKRQRHTVESLRLDIKSAMEGKTWLLLPEGFRDHDAGLTYPLPTQLEGLEAVVKVIIPVGKNDAGCRYVRRAIKALTAIRQRKQSILLDAGRKEQAAINRMHDFRNRLTTYEQESKRAMREFKEEIRGSIASLNDLFVLGRQGLEGQMRAHLTDQEWKGEKISSKQFRECFRLVSQAVKGLGVPSDEREAARDTIVEQAAEELRATQEAVALASTPDNPEKPN